ncbi:FG-GAP repeat domain-containing protein [Dactylosporangium sp. NPDC051541]|uniref:FG-GAP repeat domain-containing protein n=1 Tax=Dactylosporangium sp. NPDC051541 TaxID=3363977 RepID=UPI0037AFA054
MELIGPRRFLASLTTVVVASFGAVAVQAALDVRPAAAASSIGGQITRSEVMSRATNWYNRRNDSDMTYDQGDKTWDGTHSRQYRTDCSGYVDMAWHLGSDPNTTGLMDSDVTVSISRSQLLPGDILDDVVRHSNESSDHVIIFGGWEDSAHTLFWFYSFGGTPLTKYTHRSFSDEKFGSHPVSDYVPRRYKKIVDDTVEPDTQPGRQLADINGDGRPELIGRTDEGELFAYPHNSSSAVAGTSWDAPIQIGSGWNVYNQFIFADLDNDGLPEILGINPSGNGSLMVYPHKHGVTAIAGTSWDAPYQIGSGWNVYDQVFVADLNGDHLPELLGRTTSGNGLLMAYTHKAGVTAIQGTSWDAAQQIGSGWNIYSIIALSDLNHDGLPELLGITKSGNGLLMAYPHKAGVTAIAGTSWDAATQIGSGWNVYDAVLTGDLNADGLPELLGRTVAGNGLLKAYPHKAGNTTIAGTAWDAAVQIGSGWNVYTLLD